MNHLNYYKNKRVLITGHTGFKGSWLTFLLNEAGAKVYGISLKAKYKNTIYDKCSIKKNIKEKISDIRLLDLKKIINTFKPDIIFHLAAQSLVSVSYKHPVDTINTNVIGSLRLFEAVKSYKKKISIVIITSDKCYLNIEKNFGYSETDTLGGKDIYSCSKACTELIFKSYFESFFKKNKNLRIATARAGNVIGGGDWSVDRLIPDLMKPIFKLKKKTTIIRSPKATRPWQHVLEPLNGYLILAKQLSTNKKINGESFNFGPNKVNNLAVGKILVLAKMLWPKILFKIQPANKFFESTLLSLNCSKSKKILKWKPKLNIFQTLKLTIEWYKGLYSKQDIAKITRNQIKYYYEKK